MKVVVDTNVLVSGLLSPYHAPAHVVRMIAANELQLCYDARIITEYRQVLRRLLFRFDPQQIEALLQHIRFFGITASPNPLPFRLPDPSDEPFLETAIAEKVEFLITGNVKHFVHKHDTKVKVVSPREFIEQYSL